MQSKKTQYSRGQKEMKKRIDKLRPVYVEQIPDLLDPGLLYISMRFAICAHSCACGCGKKVFTPLGVKDWHLFYDGESITLSPSIGNYSFPCQSHYFIRENRIVWVGEKKIEARFPKTQGKKRGKTFWKRLFAPKLFIDGGK